MNGGKLVMLSGGVGGAKLALGAYHMLPEGDLTVIANTADDFVHLGLAISPDIDTLLYTLAGLSNEEQGWGRKNETWNFLAALKTIGGEDWFQLGDGDLALHVERTRRLSKGDSLSTVVADFAARWEIHANILPMSDDRIATEVDTDRGTMPFQDYFVRHRCEPALREIRFSGAREAAPSGAVLNALEDPAISAVVIAPSNPFLSIDPILSVPGMREAIGRARVPVIAVTPIVGGAAIKGPAAKIMSELGVEISPASVASHYDGLIDGFVVDDVDRQMEDRISCPTLVTNTVMRTLDDKITLARKIHGFAGVLHAERRTRGPRA